MLAGSVFAASLWALWVGIKLIWATLQALLPGSARGPFFLALADLVVSAVTVALASTMLGGYLLVVQALFTDRSEAGWPPMATFVLADVLLFGLVYLWWRQRKALKRANRKIAEAFSWRPGASATKIPAAGPSWRDMNLGQMAHMGSAASNYLTFRRAGRRLESPGDTRADMPRAHH